MEKNKNITRQNLYNIVYKELGISKSECSKLVDTVFEHFLRQFESKNKVKIAFFEFFNLKNKSSRIGRNPKTKELANIISETLLLLNPLKCLIKKLINNRAMNEEIPHTSQ